MLIICFLKQVFLKKNKRRGEKEKKKKRQEKPKEKKRKKKRVLLFVTLEPPNSDCRKATATCFTYYMHIKNGKQNNLSGHMFPINF